MSACLPKISYEAAYELIELSVHLRQTGSPNPNLRAASLRIKSILAACDVDVEAMEGEYLASIAEAAE